MAMRLRRIDGHLIALCAAKTQPQIGDFYLDDEQDHAVRVKLERDFNSEGLMRIAPYEGSEEWCLIESIEQEEKRRT